MSIIEVTTDNCFFQVDEKTTVTGHVTYSGSGGDFMGDFISARGLFSGILYRFRKNNNDKNYFWVLELELSHEERSTNTLTLRFSSKEEAVKELKSIVTQFKLKKTPLSNLQTFVDDPRSLSLALTSQNEVERKVAQLVYQLVEKNSENSP